MPEIPLTRRQLREMRERERLAQLSLESDGASDSDWFDAEPIQVAEATEAPEVAELTPAAAEVIAAEISEPALEPVVLAESDRVIVAPPADDIEHEVEDLVTEGLFSEDLHTPTVSSTEVPLPTRAQLRAEAREAARAAARSARIVRPRPASTRPASAPSNTAPAFRKKSRARGIAAQGVTVAAMAFAALIAVSTSLPAEALLSSADVQAASFQAQHDHDHDHTQELAIARGTDTITVQRDGFESKSVAEVAAASGIRLEATFTNNPNGTVQWPFAVGVHIGDQFGPRNCRGCSANHGGQDFNPGLGAPIQSIADGVVSVAHDGEGSLGVHMVIDHVINGEKISSVYAHMIHGSMLLNEGDVVKAGQVIGKTGSTGMSTGPHLHFEIRVGGKDGKKVDPLKWLYANVN
jgi:murein DD-endopeptidase MepM/ murein hydrolase activator NlpD